MHLHDWRRVVQDLTDYTRSPTLEHGDVIDICAKCGRLRSPRHR